MNVQKVRHQDNTKETKFEIHIPGMKRKIYLSESELIQLGNEIDKAVNN